MPSWITSILVTFFGMIAISCFGCFVDGKGKGYISAGILFSLLFVIFLVILVVQVI